MIVLDTNAVLDCWLFEDPRAAPLRQALEDRHLRWHATAAMMAELSAVLALPLHPRWEPQRERLHSMDWSRLHDLVPAPSGSHPLLRCADAGDQKFIDAALHLGARWLVTRDEALLRLGRRAAVHGLAIVRPQQWRRTARE